MVKFGPVTAAVLSLALALGVPAMASEAQSTGSHHKKHLHSAPHAASADSDPSLPVENALRWGYSQGYSQYPSGFGGLYGDGRYPGNTVSNPNSYNTLR